MDRITRAWTKAWPIIRTYRVELLVTIVALLLAALLVGCVQAQPVPVDAMKHRADLVRTARAVWGLDAPVATFASQIHQESAWRPDAVSRVGAQGMAQFMPATTQWIAQLYPELLGDAQPLSPKWAIRALVQYDWWLYQRVEGADPCNAMWMALWGYNGGERWRQRDQALAAQHGANPLIAAEVEPFNAGRSAVNFRENRDYPHRIIRVHQPRYVAAGFGRGVCT